MEAITKNPLFLPCEFAFTVLALYLINPVAKALAEASSTWLPYPIIFGAFLCFAYAVARFCTMLFALRSK